MLPVHANGQGELLSSSLPFLAELSPKDCLWDERKASADKVSELYKLAGFGKLADKIRFCADYLAFQLTVEGNLKLKTCRFCRVRYCPVCQWRRCLMWKARVHQGLPYILELYPKNPWLFLTLTVRNCPLNELRATVTHLNKSFQRLSQRKSFPAIGWIKTLEITRSSQAEAHPHFHCLLLVKPSYFKTGYLSHATWVNLWRESLRVDYDPSVHVARVKGATPAVIIPEVVKYQTKVSDLTSDPDWLAGLSTQMHKLRSISTGGVLTDLLNELEDDPQDLIGESDDPEALASEALLYFGWKRSSSRYKYEDV